MSNFVPDPWIETMSGLAFDYLVPEPESIVVDDIAVALSQQCRYAGHTRRFYSVAEHCLHLAGVLPPRLQLQALLHDAAEAYLPDLPRPVKALLPDYAEVEDRIWRAICARFDISTVLDPLVKEYDTRILLNERAVLKVSSGLDWGLGNYDPLPGVRIPAHLTFEDTYHRAIARDFRHSLENALAARARR